MSETPSATFSLLRTLLWPVHRSEVKKVLGMLLLLFCLCICYSILRNLKDTVILTAKDSGAEVIPFIKVWGMLPAAFIGTWVYTRFMRWFGREKVVYIMISGFLSYFLVFALFIQPHHDQLHLEWLGNRLTQWLPTGFQGLIALICNWTYTSFYIIAELWSTIVLSVLFWGFANDVTEVDQAKRTYGLLNTWSSFAPAVAGVLALFFTHEVTDSILSNRELWNRNLQELIFLVVIFGLASMGIFYWLNRKVLKNQKLASSFPEESPSCRKKPRLSMRESFRYIARSKYLLCLAFIVLGYNISINLTDVLWKAQLKKFFTDPNEMLTHMYQITIGIGIFATTAGIFFTYMVQRWGWTLPALITPVVMLTMAVGFFSFLFGANSFLGTFATHLLGLSPLALTVYCGSLQNCLSKASKYSVFDSSKELAFLPLEPEARLKGKAAIDGLGSGIGKSGASLSYQGFIILLGSVAQSTPYIAAILMVVLVIWIFSVFAVGKRFKKMHAAQEILKGEVLSPGFSPILLKTDK